MSLYAARGQQHIVTAPALGGSPQLIDFINIVVSQYGRLTADAAPAGGSDDILAIHTWSEQHTVPDRNTQTQLHREVTLA